MKTLLLLKSLARSIFGRSEWRQFAVHFAKNIPGTTRWLDIRLGCGWLVIHYKPVFLVYWSNDATPPTRRERNGFWIIGSYGKWAQSLAILVIAFTLAGCAVSRDMQTGETRLEGRLTIEDLEAINRIVRGKELPATRGYAK